MTFDERTERNIASLHPKAQERARAFMQLAVPLIKRYGLDVRIISGLRTFAEQDALYAQGRTSKGRIVTNARAGYSNHNFGIAFDIGVFQGKTYLGEHALYDELGPLGESLGLEWGGRWKTIVDKPHYQFRPKWANGMTESEMLVGLRRKVAERVDILS
jgi:peptidoglycan L-alanyl-D-glutamate endopeptidase CwlK